MLHKFSAWTHLSNTNPSKKIEHRAWPGWEKSKATIFPACNGWLNFRVRGQFEIKILIVRHINTKYFIWIKKKIKLEPPITWKLVTCQRITSKKYLTSMGRHLSARYGQVILVSGYPILTAVNWSKHWCPIYVHYQFSCAPKLAKWDWTLFVI